MKKNFIASVVAAAALSVSAVAFAANPTVVLDNRTINFEDQPAIISEEGRTLVPARGVFENMGARVDWFESDRSISVTSEDSLTKVVLKIDDSTMKVRHFTGLMDYTEEVFTLDTAPQIINDRTMIPLRAVSEAFDCDVQWDADAYKVIITTVKDEPVAEGEQAEDKRVKMSISVDKEDVNAGDEVNVYVNVTNLPDENLVLTSSTSRIFYDSTKFEFVKSEPIVQDTTKQILGGSNVIAENSSVKSAFLIMDSNEAVKDGVLHVCTFKALTDEGGEFTLSNEVSTTRGSDTSVEVVNAESKAVLYAENDTLTIDTTPVVVK